jgi:hypothetical protein
MSPPPPPAPLSPATIAARQARNRAAAEALIRGAPQQAPPPSDDAYVVSAADRAAFERDGFVVLRNVMSEEEMRRDVDPVFFGFFRGDPGCVAPGLDTCDMGLPSAAKDEDSGNGNGQAAARPPLTADQCALFNVMLPRLYYAGADGNEDEDDQKPHCRLIGSVLEQRCASIASQLRGRPGGGAAEPHAAAARFAVDFDQILSKRPAAGGDAAEAGRSLFGWHQDAAYWPPLEGRKDEGDGDGGASPAAPPLNLAALNCWLCVSREATERHGCMLYLPGTHREPQLRRHVPVGGSRAESHAIHVEELPEFEMAGAEGGSKSAAAVVVAAPARRGDVVVHHERVLHCSPANATDEWRHAYVLGMRTPETIAAERRAGFAHTHNGALQWDSFGGGG